jgi:ribosomal protein S18 acetylase RimI-like enzyme
MNRPLQQATPGAATELGTVEVRDLRRDELPAAVELLALATRDNPIHLAVYGPDAERRRRCHRRLMRGLFATFRAQQPLAAVSDGVLVGVTGVAPAGTCQPTAGQRLRLLPTLAGLGLRTASRAGKWIGTWAEHDLAEAHVHPGPLGVELDLQGRGVGTQLLQEHVRRLDAEHAVGYLETDKPEKVRLYERFGYAVTGELPILRVPNWFMRRPAR